MAIRDQLTKDRPPVATAGWRPAGAHHVSASDQDTATRLGVLARMAPALARSAPAVLAMMRDNMTGQPQAAHYGSDGPDDRDPRSALWCFDHQCTADQCELPRLAEDGTVLSGCAGVKLTGPSDPAGNAALLPDRAAADRAKFARHVERAARELDEALAIASAYPAVAMTPADADETPGDDICRAHWKCRKYAKLIERKGDGTPYYKGLCRWCGITRKALGGDRLGKGDPAGDPPTWLVQAHIDGNVSQAQVDKAQRQIDGAVARRASSTRPSSSTKKRRRK